MSELEIIRGVKSWMVFAWKCPSCEEINVPSWDHWKSCKGEDICKPCGAGPYKIIEPWE